MNIVIAGGTGFVGNALCRSLVRGGHQVVILTRSAIPRELQAGTRAVRWDPRGASAALTAELRSADAVVNLAGASIGGGRWTSARKRLLVDSRVRSTQALVRAIAALPAEERPRVLVAASGIDYYGDRSDDQPLDERAAPGTSFLARLCVQWEAAAQEAESLGVRVVCMRTAFCIGRGATALRMLALPFRFFAGGPVGSGRQRFTWIHVEDLVHLYTLAIERSDLAGPVNAVAPHVPREAEVAREIGRVLYRPSWLPAPPLMLRLVLGEMADLLLHGRNAVPGAARSAGYQFRYPDLQPALEQALRR